MTVNYQTIVAYHSALYFVLDIFIENVVETENNLTL